MPQRQFFHQKSHLPNPGWNPSRRGEKPATNSLSCGKAIYGHLGPFFHLMFLGHERIIPFK
jgi:hypothetical protein